MTHITVRFEHGTVAEQPYQQVTRIVGFVNARNLLSLFDIEDLNANPRTAKVGEVTESIIDSIKSSPSTFPFKTKGVLLGTTNFASEERGRYRLTFENTDYEGIMDGGHNMLAIGLHILSSMPDIDQGLVKKLKDWPAFKDFWVDARERVLSVASSDDKTVGQIFDFVVPVEIIVPTDENEEALASFRASLAEICEARNHNVQLTDEALANYQGLYDDFRQSLDPAFAKRVQWKQNEVAEFKVREILALSVIALNRLPLPSDAEGQIKPLPPTNPYNSKAACVRFFNRLIQAPSISERSPDGTKTVVKDEGVLSAFKLTGDLPAIYDEIYKLFPEHFNAAGAQFGSMEFVKKAKDLRTAPTTRYSQEPVTYQYPDGFIFPLVVGVNKLINLDEDGLLTWKTDPIAFIRDHFRPVVDAYKPYIETLGRNPQKVGKDAGCYRAVETAIELEMFRSGLATL